MSNFESTTNTVLVAMTGRMDSTVAAYLLKKQGYNPVGVAFNFYSANDLKDYRGDFVCHYHLASTERVKAVCDFLEIPYIEINAQSEFKALVLDRAVAARLSGVNFSLAPIVTKLIVDLLYREMRERGFFKIATGHYARLQFSSLNKLYTIVSANDVESDQSYDLSLVGPLLLSKLILPMGDLRIPEVTKIALSIGVNLDQSIHLVSDTYRFFHSDELTRYTENNTPKRLKRGGAILDRDNDAYCFDHNGVFNYYVGQSNVGVGDLTIDSKLIVEDINPETGSIYVANKELRRAKKIFLENFEGVLMKDIARPIIAFAKFEPHGNRYECLLTFKNNGGVILEFNGELPTKVFKGQIAAIYAKETANGRLLGAGKIKLVGDFHVSPRVEGSELSVNNNLEEKFGF